MNNGGPRNTATRDTIIRYMISFAKEKGKQPIDLTDEEKNRFVTGGKVENLQSMIQASVKYHSLDEWNLAQ